MMIQPRSRAAGIAACCLFAAASPAHAGHSYGIYDARTMAMGSASVASANNDNAQFYNAALLAFNEEIEERTQDGRILFPLIAPELSESAIDLEELSSDDVPRSVSDSVAAFNADMSAETAQAVVDTTSTLDAYLAGLDGEDLRADVYFGMGLTEPGKFQGAGFFLGGRLLGGGQSDITEADRAILAAYEEGLSYIASDGAVGQPRPELFDDNGNLIDPIDSLTSSASAVGVTIIEVGVAMSAQFELFGGPIAAGISFKALEVETFEDTQLIVDDRISVDRNRERDTHVNVDVGVVKELGDRWRVGLAVKDIVPHNYRTSLGTVVRLRPRGRIGASYQAGRMQIAADLDVARSEPVGTEQPTQEAALGAEWVFGPALKLRAGYRQDVLGNRDGIASIGIGTRWNRLVADLAYAESGDARAAALQFGMAF